MIRSKRRTIIILFIIASIFLFRETRSVAEPILDMAGGSKIEYKAEGLKDPFQEEKIEIKEEPEIETKPLPPLNIQGIVWGGALPQAIINNKVVKIGDTIEEVRIIDITKSGITVLFGKQKYNLSIPSISNLNSPKGEKDEKQF